MFAGPQTAHELVVDAAELAEQYQPQMLAYALALLQHDQGRDVRASLRFTNAGVEEQFNWGLDQVTDIQSELRPMMDLVE